MSNKENKPELPAIDSELAARVKEKLGWEYPTDDGGKQDDLEIKRNLQGLSEVDPEVAKVEQLLSDFLKGEQK